LSQCFEAVDHHWTTLVADKEPQSAAADPDIDIGTADSQAEAGRAVTESSVPGQQKRMHPLEVVVGIALEHELDLRVRKISKIKRSRKVQASRPDADTAVDYSREGAG